MNLKWSQHFHNYLADFENKYKLAQTPLSPLGFALSQKIIPMDQYLKWAQTTYHLPAIHDDYFNTHLPSSEDWKTWKSEFQWSEEIVPIGLWDGHLLVACLEIPARFPASFYPIFLLADFKHTQRTFAFYNNSEKGSESARKLKEQMNPTQPAQLQNQSPARTQSQQTDLGKKEFNLIELSDEAAANVNPDEVLEIIEEQPEGLNFNFVAEPISPNPSSTTKPAQAQSNEVTFDSLDIGSTPPKEEISLKFTNVEVNSSISNVPAHSVSKKVGQDTNTGFTNTSMTRAGITTMTTIGSILPTNIQTEINKGLPYFIAIKKDNPTNFENLTQNFFSKVSNIFEKFILVALDPSELHAVPVSWTDNISPRSKDLEKLDLSEPSIFKTVASTLKSYHGYIVLNECNEKFFEFWNQGQVPGNITMVPLIVKNKLVGMWMGLGESNTYNWNTLKQMESRSKEMCEAFSNLYKESSSATDAA